MMLQALIAYADRRSQEQPGFADPDFQPVEVRWLIPVDKHGKLSGGPIPLSDDPSAKKPPPKTLLRPLTPEDELNQGDKAYFLCDSLQRAVAMPNPKEPEKAEARRVQHAYFKGLLKEAGGACPAEAARLNAFLTLLEDPTELQRLHAALTGLKARPTDNATFEVDEHKLLDSPELKDFWRARRQQLRASAKTNRRVCVATGQLAETLQTTDKIKGLPGGAAKLISFDKASFTSFGLEKAQNAAISLEAEVKIRSALNELIEQGLRLQNAVWLHWTRQKVDHDPLDLLATADETAVCNLLEAPRTGFPQSDLEANAYYAMSLSVNGARIVVRDWLESTVPEVENNVRRWFQDLAIVETEGRTCRNNFKATTLLSGMANFLLEDPYSVLPQGASEHLVHSALTNSPLPQSFLAAALRRETVDRAAKDEETARFALIKACLIRSPNRKEHHTMTKKLDPNSKDVAYLCGQLFAVLVRLQLLALGKVGASIAERTYGGVATRPATTLGPLFTKVPAYLKKANDRFPGAGTNRQKEIETLCQRIEAQAGLPQTLGLEEQGRFALGYYCQLAEYRARREEAEIEAKAEELTDETL